jgi:predicted ATP-binding protein involved in virulence
MNYKNGVYLEKIELSSIRSFDKNSCIDFKNKEGKPAQWNVILGDNGVGKTFLLRWISIIRFGEKKELNFIDTIFNVRFLGDNIIFPTLYQKQKSIYFIYKFIYYDSLLDNECKYFSLDLHEYFFEKIKKRLSPLPIANKYFILSYGANRIMDSVSLLQNDTDPAETLFNDDAKLINAEAWLLQLDYTASVESDIKASAIAKRDKVIAVLIELLPDVSNIYFTKPDATNPPKVQFYTDFGVMSLDQLSLGYRTMIAWVVDLAYKMFARYPESEYPLQEPAVVLVDEIDLHLHPKWQRSIFQYLSTNFPNIQFIVTAHSPLVVQAAPHDANIILLKKEVDDKNNTVVKIVNDVESVNTWRIDQILSSDLYGNISGRSEDTNSKLARRTVLIQKENLTEKEQKELDDLTAFSQDIPTADTQLDIEAMELIRTVAKKLKEKANG